MVGGGCTFRAVGHAVPVSWISWIWSLVATQVSSIAHPRGNGNDMLCDSMLVLDAGR